MRGSEGGGKGIAGGGAKAKEPQSNQWLSGSMEAG